MKRELPTSILLTVALIACADRELPASAAPASTAETILEPDQPDQDIPPATAPPTSPAPTGPTPAEGAIGYAGFGPAEFGADEEAVRIAWGKELKADAPSEPGGCYYLFPQPDPQGGYGVAFMIEGDKFARIDVDSADIAAPGGGRIGMGADEINERYAGRVEARKHKYVDGAQYLRVSAPRRGNGVLVFETDAAGTITGWRIGVPPQVDYVEGCA